MSASKRAAPQRAQPNYAARPELSPVSWPPAWGPAELWSKTVLALVALYAALALDRIWVTEDAFITFRSVEMLWAGEGPNFNQGLRVESFSHPLWFMLLSILRLAGTELLPLLSAVCGIALSAVGLWCMVVAGQIRARGLPFLFPLGGILVVALPPFWDFASSGLETGLTFAWIGASALTLSRIAFDRRQLSLGDLFLIGLGPLVRIDLLSIAVPLAALALLSPSRNTESIWTRALQLFTLAIPATAWQVFRMGYYGLIVPNTYLAKEGFETWWSQGLIYLSDTYTVYALYPLLVLGLALSVHTVKSLRRPKTSQAGPIPPWGIPLALAIGGIIHTTLVCKAGGDFMHGRLLLPGLFALASSCAVVSLPSNMRRFVTTTALVWATWAALLARPSYISHISEQGIADERLWYQNSARITRPVSLDDYRYHPFYRIGLATVSMMHRQHLRALYWAHIGITVTQLPLDNIIIDPLALNDHIGSHTSLTARGRPGHEKVVRAAWFLSRYPGGVGLVVRNQLKDSFRHPETPQAIAAARRVLEQGPLREINDAVTKPMNMELFFTNLLRAWRLTFVRIPQDPEQALKEHLLASDL